MGLPDPAADSLSQFTIRLVGPEQDIKLADLVLLGADPTQDVKNFQQIDAVYKGGKRIDLAALDLPVNHH